MLKRVFTVVLLGMRYDQGSIPTRLTRAFCPRTSSLAQWSAKIKEQSAWKYSKPCDNDEYKKAGGRGEPGHEYEKVIRYNYSNDEMFALIDVIGMIKG